LSASADTAASPTNSSAPAVIDGPAVIIPPTRKTLSALICNYNDGAFIGTAIAAMAAQKRLPDELLIMDDGSTDNSVDVMTWYADKYPWIKIYRRETNAGYISGISELTAIAKGDFVHRGTSDDYALPNFIALTMEQAERHPQVGIVSGELLNRNESHTGLVHIGIRDWESGYVSPEVYLHDYLERSEPYCTLAPSTIFRRAVIDEVGGWRRDLDIWDVSFVLQAAALKYGMCYVDAQVYTWIDRPRRWTANTNKDLAKTASMCLRYYELMRSPEFRPLFGETFPCQWLKCNLNQGAQALYESTVDQFG
jgi:glycosyltransferase involved in cell wall biosynthesis